MFTCQYRETGVFMQRGFTLKDFMSQLTANRNDPGKGRNMPVHYSGKNKVGAVSTSQMGIEIGLRDNLLIACRCFNFGNTDPPCYWSRLCPQDGSVGKPDCSPKSGSLLLWRRSCKRRGFPRCLKCRRCEEVPCYLHLPE